MLLLFILFLFPGMVEERERIPSILKASSIKPFCFCLLHTVILRSVLCCCADMKSTYPAATWAASHVLCPWLALRLPPAHPACVTPQWHGGHFPGLTSWAMDIPSHLATCSLLSPWESLTHQQCKPCRGEGPLLSECNLSQAPGRGDDTKDAPVSLPVDAASGSVGLSWWLSW